jgi:hypothetical protein
MAQTKTMELRFPMRGIGRRDTLRSTPEFRGPWPSPWGVNVRVLDSIDRRLRGGSRPGLTDFGVGGASVDLVSVNTSDGGAQANLVVLGSAGFLVAGSQYAYSVTTSGITKITPGGGSEAVIATAGAIPTGQTFGAIYRDRFCLSGQDNAIYMSRQGDYSDWDYGAHAEDSGRALAFQLGLASDVGPLPTAMIAHKDTHLILASQTSLWVVSGDPAADGMLRRVSENVGIISRRAWTRLEDTICFLSADGVYRVQADGSELAPLSEEIPEELRDINPATTTVSMGYEHDRMCVHIFLRTAAGSDTHWVYELETQSWWAVRLQDSHSPVATCLHEGQLLLAGGDGSVRAIGGSDDDGEDIESHVVIGPLRLGTATAFGRLLKLHGMIAAGSGTVNWRIVPGDTAEEAADNAKAAIEAFQAGDPYASYVAHSGVWTAGRAIMAYPRTRAVWVCLWLQSTGQWAYEGAIMESTLSGRWRGA